MVENTLDPSNEVQALEASIKRNTALIDLGNSLERLRSNKDFKKVILEAYFEQESIRLVQLKADPSMQKEENQRAILKQMDAIGAVGQYFQTVFHLASLARKSVEADEDMRDELLAGEME